MRKWLSSWALLGLLALGLAGCGHSSKHEHKTPTSVTPEQKTEQKS